jgi:cyanophycinase-like exopeptidase
MHGTVRVCALLSLAVAACAGGGESQPPPALVVPLAPEPSAPPPDTSPQVVFYPRVGSVVDDGWGSLGPGVVLMNTPLAPAGAFAWIHDTVGPRRVSGDVVALCTRGDDAYSEALYAAASFNSVQTVLVPPGSRADDVALVAQLIAAAEIVYLGDGDPAAYAAWGATPLGDAIRRVYYRGGVIAGAGPGATALGWAVLTSSATSAQALADPYAHGLTLARGAPAIPLLAGTVVDRDVVSADRFGVLAAMTARAVADGLADTTAGGAMGIGLEGHSALAVDRTGRLTLLDDGAAPGGAWIVHGDAVDRVTAGQPLLWTKAQVTRFDAAGESLSPAAACGTAFSYDVAIDGAATPPYTPTDPYGAQGTASPCSP